MLVMNESEDGLDLSITNLHSYWDLSETKHILASTHSIVKVQLLIMLLEYFSFMFYFQFACSNDFKSFAT